MPLESTPVGSSVAIYWKPIKKWFHGKVVSHNEDGSVAVKYDDGDQEDAVHLREEKWKLVEVAQVEQATPNELALQSTCCICLAACQVTAEGVLACIGDNCHNIAHLNPCSKLAKEPRRGWRCHACRLALEPPHKRMATTAANSNGRAVGRAVDLTLDSANGLATDAHTTAYNPIGGEQDCTVSGAADTACCC